jgi:hypothetical protein
MQDVKVALTNGRVRRRQPQIGPGPPIVSPLDSMLVGQILKWSNQRADLTPTLVFVSELDRGLEDVSELRRLMVTKPNFPVTPLLILPEAEADFDCLGGGKGKHLFQQHR